MALPALAAPLLTGAATAVGGKLVNKFVPNADPGVNHGGSQMDGYSEGLGAKGALGLGGAGAATGWAMGRANAPEGATAAEKMVAGTTGALKMGAAGVLTNSANNAIQADGGGFKAAVFGGAANMLASTMQEDGPNMLQAALTGAAGNYGLNFAHDTAVDKGYGLAGDMIAGTGQGAILGHNLTGDVKGTGIGAGLGAALGGVNAFSTQREGEAAAADSMSLAEQEMLAADSSAQRMLESQQNGSMTMDTSGPSGLGAVFNQNEPQSQAQKDDDGMSL